MYRIFTYDFRREFILLLILYAFLSQVLGKKPNVLLLVIDDLRPALGSYSDKNAYTPNIDKLANKSFVFTNAFAQQALCAPSRNSFLTSRRPDSLRLYDFYSYWRDTVGNFTTIPQHFKENGYFTYSIGKVFHPGISSNFTDDEKYSWSKPAYHPPTEVYKEAKVCRDDSKYLARNLLCPVIVDEQPGGSLPDLESLGEAVRFLDKYKQDLTAEPFFLAVGFHKPHIPLKFPIEYLEKHPIENVTIPKNLFRPSSMPIVAWNPWTDLRHRDDIASLNISFPFGLMPDEITRKIVQHYNAATSYVDDLIGEILEKIDLQNTIIVLMGDHGWSMGEHGEFSKYSNFDLATRVPLIIRVPQLNEHMVLVQQFVELVDLFPTLVDLTQISTSLDICKSDKSNSKLCTEGTSLVSMMVSSLHNDKRHSQLNERSAVFTQYPRPGDYPTENPNSDKPHLHEIQIMGYSIRTPQYRFTEWVKFNNTNCTPIWNGLIDRELYDHFIDPHENLNLANRPEMSNIVQNLRHRLILGWRHA